MKQTNLENLSDCPAAEISSYVDGELSAAEESVLEHHLADCPICRAELNEQKSFLQALSLSLENESDIDLPADFTKKIVIKAESSVSGLRGRRERIQAVLVAMLLLAFVVAAAGSESALAFAPVAGFIEQSGVVLSFIGHLAYNFVFGTTLFLRSATALLFVNSTILTFLFAATALVFVLLVFRKILRQDSGN